MRENVVRKNVKEKGGIHEMAQNILWRKKTSIWPTLCWGWVGGSDRGGEHSEHETSCQGGGGERCIINVGQSSVGKEGGRLKEPWNGSIRKRVRRILFGGG